MSNARTISEPTNAKRRAAMDDRRRADDGVAELPDGFTVKARGREGVVYYRDGERVLELPYELDGTRPGILLYEDGLATWVLPSQRPTTDSERKKIRGELEHWAQQQSGAVTFTSRDELIRPWE